MTLIAVRDPGVRPLPAPQARFDNGRIAFENRIAWSGTCSRMIRPSSARPPLTALDVNPPQPADVFAVGEKTAIQSSTGSIWCCRCRGTRRATRVRVLRCGSSGCRLRSGAPDLSNNGQGQTRLSYFRFFRPSFAKPNGITLSARTGVGVAVAIITTGTPGWYSKSEQP